MPARNMLVQLLALYTDPQTESHSLTDVTDRQSDGPTNDNRVMPVGVEVRSAKNQLRRVARGFIC